MIQIAVKQAEDELEAILDKVAHGQDLVIIDANGLAFKLMALPWAPQPVFGSARVGAGWFGFR